MKSKRNSSINKIIQILLIVSFIGITFYFAYKNIDYVNHLLELSRYYQSMGNIQKSMGYQFLHHFYTFLIFFIVGLIGLVIEVYSFIEDLIEFRRYSGIKKERTNKFYFNITGILFLWMYCYLYIFNVPLQYFSFLFIASFPFQLLFSYIKGRMFKALDKKVKSIRKQEYEDDEEEDLPYRDQTHMSFILFCLLLVVTFIVLGVNTDKYLTYRQYNHYPQELIVTEETILDDDRDRKVCRTGYNLIDCYFEDVLDEYDLDTIVIHIDENDFNNLETNFESYSLRLYDDYEIDISDLTEYHTVEQEETQYRLSIDFRDYIEKSGTLNGDFLDIYYVDQDGERIDMDANEFKLTFLKRGDK